MVGGYLQNRLSLVLTFSLVFSLLALSIPLSVSLMALSQLLIIITSIYNITVFKELKNRKVTILDWLVLLLVVGLTLSFIFSINPTRSFNKYFIILGMILMYFSARTSSKIMMTDFDIFYDTLAIASIVSGTWVLIDYVLFGGRANGPFDYFNVTAQALSISSVILAYSLTLSPKPLRIIGLLLSLLGLLLTFSRSGWIATILALAFLILTRPYKKLKTIILATTILLILIFLIVGAYSRLSIHSITSGLTPRLNLWDASIKIFKDFPLFGSGPDTLHILLPKYLKFKIQDWLRAFHAHNNYIDTLAQLGIFNFIIIILITLTMVYYLLRLYKARVKHVEVFIGLQVAIFMLGIFDYSLFSVIAGPVNWLSLGYITNIVEKL